MKKKIIWILGIIIVIIVVIVFFSKDNQQPDIFKIGYIGPMTGPSAVLGMDAVKALEIARDEINSKGGINGKKVEVIFEDDKYLTKDTVNAYSKLVNIDKVKVVLIATYGGVFALADQAKKDNVIIIDPLDCNSDIAGLNDNVFCLATETESIGESLANHMIKNGQTSAAIMYSSKDSFMSLVASAFSKTFESKGGKITAKEQFNYDDSDFKTQLSKIKITNPETLILLGHDETGIIMNQARAIGIVAPFMTTGTITSPPLQEAANGYAEGALFAYWESSKDNELAKQFEDKFIESVGRPPILPLTTHPAYDTLMVLADVFANIKGQITDDKIRTELLKVKNYAGVTGIISFDDDGGARIKESVFKLVNGMPVRVQ
jgi:branched-chain amino acid transport system substrate-binding protein